MKKIFINSLLKLSRTSAIVFTIALGTASTVSAKEFPDLDAHKGTYELTYQNGDILHLIQHVAANLNIDFLVHPSVNARVNFQTAEKLTARQLYDTFTSVLKTHGYTTTAYGGFTKIERLEKPSNMLVGTDYDLILQNESLTAKRIASFPFYEDEELIGYKVTPETAKKRFATAQRRLSLPAPAGEIRDFLVQAPKMAKHILSTSPYEENGVMIGYEIGPSRHFQAFEPYGLMIGDIITRVNEIPLYSQKQGMLAIEVASSANALNIDVLRDGTEVALTISLVN